jgi:hypothetical protein
VVVGVAVDHDRDHPAIRDGPMTKDCAARGFGFVIQTTGSARRSDSTSSLDSPHVGKLPKGFQAELERQERHPVERTRRIG